MSFITMRRTLAAGASTLAILAPVAATATAAPAVSGSFGSFGSPLMQHNSGISNWGGYIALGNQGAFTSVSAEWVIEQVSCINGALFAPWVGLDGDGSNTVEQTGAATQCNGSTASYAAWYEMYPNPPVYYNDPISVGDHFKASVTASGTNFTLTISDVTKGWTETVTKSLSSAKLSSAEAVIEGPGGYPNINKQHFTNVMINGKPLAQSHPVKSRTQSGTQTIYKPSKITNGTDFVMKPQH